jgi:hypothetical protein
MPDDQWKDNPHKVLRWHKPRFGQSEPFLHNQNSGDAHNRNATRSSLASATSTYSEAHVLCLVFADNRWYRFASWWASDGDKQYDYDYRNTVPSLYLSFLDDLTEA